MKSSDSRCCGSGVCIINQAGECWCGQVWDGEKMIHLPLKMGSSTDREPKDSQSSESLSSHSQINR